MKTIMLNFMILQSGRRHRRAHKGEGTEGEAAPIQCKKLKWKGTCNTVIPVCGEGRKGIFPEIQAYEKSYPTASPKLRASKCITSYTSITIKRKMMKTNLMKKKNSFSFCFSGFALGRVK